MRPASGDSPLVGFGLLTLAALGAAFALLLASRGSAPAAAAPVNCEFTSRAPTEHVTTTPGVVGLVLICDRPVELEATMRLDGVEVPVDTYARETDWTIVARTTPEPGPHHAHVEARLAGRTLTDEWAFTYTPPVRTPPGPDSQPAVVVIERASGAVDFFEFDHIPQTCGGQFVTFFCAPHREIPFLPVRYAERDFFAGVLPLDASIRPRDPRCHTALRATTGPAAAPAAPAAPSRLTVEALPVLGGTGARLSWADRATDETCYVVERATWGQYPDQVQVLAVLPADATSYVDAKPYGGRGGVAYRVYAANGSGRSSATAMDGFRLTSPATAPSPVCFEGVPGVGAPQPPKSLAANLEPPVSRAGWQVALNWGDIADGEACYVVEVLQPGQPPRTLQLPANATEAGPFDAGITRTFQTWTFRVSVATDLARSEPAEISVEVPPLPSN